MMKARLLAGTTLLGLVLSGCGGSSPGGAGGAGSVVLPPPPAAPAPPPAQPASALDFDTAEVGRSNGATQARAVAAWQEGASGAGVVVAVIDSGVTPSLPAFSGRISSQSRDIAGNRGLADDDGHGTSVSGVLAAARDGEGIVGVAWGATLLALRVDNPGSCATSDGCRYSSNAIAQGYDIASQAGARVVNLSLGGSALAPTVAAAAQRAGAAGVVTVVAAGNDASSEITPFAAGLVEAAPATTLVVGALDAGGAMASFSNRARAAANNYLTALGVRVRSFDETGAAKLYSGTSEAAPIVSGAVALLADAFPALSGSEIARILLQTADDLGAPGTDPVFGRGQLNIERAFQPIGFRWRAWPRPSRSLAAALVRRWAISGWLARRCAGSRGRMILAAASPPISLPSFAPLPPAGSPARCSLRAARSPKPAPARCRCALSPPTMADETGTATG